MEVLTIDEDVEVIEVDSEGTPSTQQSQPAASGFNITYLLELGFGMLHVVEVFYFWGGFHVN